MIYGRRYIQFNNLVIDGFDMIEETETDVSFKYVSHEYSFGHGSYAPFKQNYMFAEEASVSLTLYLYMKKLPCEERPFYRTLAISELSKPGKLWAVQNGELVWAYAVLTNYGETDSYRADMLTINVDLTLPEGIWHKADLQKTFLKPYDVCNFMDCYDFKKLEPCKNTLDGECCEVCNSNGSELKDASCNCCECDVLCKDWALCYNLDRLQNVYSTCNNGLDFQIEYNCSKGQEFFGDEYIGQKFCEKDSCTGIIAGNVYADTDIPTTSFDIVIRGYMVDPAITINDNTNIIEGDFSEYNGTMTIKSNGDVYYRQSDCCEDTLVEVGNWTVPEGNDYGWTLNPGGNRFIVNTNNCCGRACAYVQVDGLTI